MKSNELALIMLAFCILASCQKKNQPSNSEQSGNPPVVSGPASPIHTSTVLFDGGNESIYHSLRMEPQQLWQH